MPTDASSNSPIFPIIIVSNILSDDVIKLCIAIGNVITNKRM